MTWESLAISATKEFDLNTCTLIIYGKQGDIISSFSSFPPHSCHLPCASLVYGKWKDKSRWLGTNQWYLSHCKATKNIIISIIIFSDIYKVLDDVLGQGAHTIVKSCVKLVTNQEYAVKVGNYFLWLLPERGTAILWVILVCAAVEVMVFMQFGLG